ncbi:MAG: hypothetical protein OEV40_31395 [Acidimicrobiia bacterium]|nr:hypothetical protein [Acidimicrobiia bacterium]
MTTETALSIEATHRSGQAPIREDLTEAMAGVWHRLGQPGPSWSAPQRLAMARVARAAATDPDPLPPWVKPSTVDDRASDPDLSPNIGDAIYRLTLHAATLTEDWYRTTLALAEVTPEQWIEAIEVVVAVVAIDGFAAAAGLPFAALPPPEPGPPLGVGDVPSRAARHHWVPVQHLEDGHGYYGDVPRVPPVIRALSAVPRCHRTMHELIGAMYMDGRAMADMDWTRGTLDRRQIELVASRLSSLRECFY